jgi:UDP-2,3-diacylglucosamine hydrolase
MRPKKSFGKWLARNPHACYRTEKILSKIYFLSDAHLGSSKPRRPERDQEEALIEFLRAIQADAEALYIVGDLFDFWFEYRSAVSSRAARVTCELYALVQSGVQVIYIPGNHDLWPGHYFSEQLGLELPGDPVVVTHQGKRIYVTHGDSFRTDWKFKISRFVLKHPLSVGLFRLLHPDIGNWLARRTSRYSEIRTRKDNRRTIHNAKTIYLRGAEKIINSGFDLVVCGHYHHLKKVCIQDGTLVVLGDWMRYDSYAVLENGDITLHQWKTAPEQYQDTQPDQDA